MTTELQLSKDDTNSHGNPKGFLTLPFDDEQFKAFISGLLGNPQTITKRIRGLFDLNLSDLKNFHELITQRVLQQNNARLIQMQAKIYYNDDSSVLLGCYEELLTYNEVKPVISEAVRMKWSYLIKFEDKKAPEKQEIELMIIASPMRDTLEGDFSPVIQWGREGEFRITIEHTARSWGFDIESLLTNQINSVLLPLEKWKIYIRKKSGLIGLLSGLVFFFITVVSVYLVNVDFIKKQTISIQNIIGDKMVDSGKLDYLIRYLVTNSQNLIFLKSLCFVVGSVFFAVVLGFWVSSLAENQPSSYLPLTREAVKARDISKAKTKRKLLFFFLSIVLNILVSLVASYIFLLLVGR